MFNKLYSVRMNKNINNNINILNNIEIPLKNNNLKNDIINLYSDRVIFNFKTSQNFINKLNNNRSIKSVTKKVNNIKYKQQLQNYNDDIIIKSNKKSSQERFNNLSNIKKEIIDHRIKRNYMIDMVLPILINENTKQPDGTYKMIRKPIEFKKTSILYGSKTELINRAQLYMETEAKIDEKYDEDLEPEFQEVKINSIKPVTNSDLSKVHMGSKKYSYSILKNSESININDGECVIDYLMYELKTYYPSITREKIILKLGTSNFSIYKGHK